MSAAEALVAYAADVTDEPLYPAALAIAPKVAAGTATRQERLVHGMATGIVTVAAVTAFAMRNAPAGDVIAAVGQAVRGSAR